MKRRHFVSFLILSAWAVFAVWVGSTSFDVGECVAIAFIVSGLWIAFAVLHSLAKGREGRCALFSLPLILVVAWAAYSPSQDHGTLTVRPGETRAEFVKRVRQAVIIQECH